MMRHFLSYLALIALLFANIEGAAELVDHGLPHDKSILHERAHSHTSDEHEAELSHAESDSVHCDHCCHAHFSSIVCLHSMNISVAYSGQMMVLRDDDVPEFLSAPPTPPPDPTPLS